MGFTRSSTAIAEALSQLAAHFATLPAALPAEVSISFDIATGSHLDGTPATRRAAIDALCAAIGVAPRVGYDGTRYGTEMCRVSVGVAAVSILASIEDEARVDLEAENARLRAEVEQLRAQTPAADVDPGPEHPCPRCHAQPGEDCEPDCNPDAPIGVIRATSCTSCPAAPYQRCTDRCGCLDCAA